MNPALLQYLTQAQQEGASQLQDASNPWGQGIGMAIQAAKQALSPSEAEKRRALGLGIMKFFSQMGQPGNHGDGIQGALGRANNALLPALDSYQNYLTNAEKQNAMLMGHYNEMKHRQELLEHRKRESEERLHYHKELLAEQKRLHDRMHHQRQSSSQQREDPSLSSLGEEEIPFSMLTPKAVGTYQSNVLKMSESIPEAQKVIQAATQLKELYKKHPTIANSSVAALLDHNPGVVSQMLLRSTTNEEERGAIETAAKLSSDMRLALVGALSAKAGARSVTDVIKRWVEKASPGISQGKISLDKIADTLTHHMNSQISTAKKALGGLKRGVVVPFNYHELSEEGQSIASAKDGLSQPHKSLSNLSNEELLSLYNSYQNRGD